MMRHSFVHPDDVQVRDDGSHALPDGPYRIVIFAEHDADQPCDAACLSPEDRAAWLAEHPDAVVE